MRVPELLLDNLNQSLRALLGATAVLEDERVEEELRPVIQRLLLAQVLGDQSIIAIGGSQGAGKTTLLAALYGLSCDEASWLNANEGRGEQLPVLIVEDKTVTAAQGSIRKLESGGKNGNWGLKDVPVDPVTFRRACGGGIADALLPVLRVPPRYFANTNHALMLLPGYERLSRENSTWQALMRQAMIGASGCVIVTDRTRLANQQQHEILSDASQPDLKTLDTLIVVTKTEDLAANAEAQKQTRVSAAQAFGISDDRVDERVLCVGVSDAVYVGDWFPKLENAIRQIGSGVAKNRNAQLAHLEETINRDLGRAIATLQGRARTFLHHAEDESLTPITRCLEVFDDACHALREDYRRGIGELLSERTGAAWKDLENRLKDDYEGVKNKFTSLFDTTTETQQKIQGDIEAAWGTGGRPVLDGVAQVIGTLVEDRLGAPSLPFANAIPVDANLPRRLGYVDQNDAPVAWREPSPETLDNLKALFYERGNITAQQGSTNKTLESSVKLLPALGLEYIRAASLVPSLVGVAERGVGKLPDGDVMQSMTNVQQQLAAFGDKTSNILKGLAVVMSIDFLANGELNSVAPLWSLLGMAGSGGAAAGAAGSGAAATGAATAMTAVSAIGAAVATAVTVGFLVYAGMREVRQYDNQVRAFGFEALQGIKDRHQLHFVESFDRLMARLRERLEAGLRHRYHIDETLMRQDRLAKAIADVKQYRLDLLDEIARSGRTLDVFQGVLAA